MTREVTKEDWIAARRRTFAPNPKLPHWTEANHWCGMPPSTEVRAAIEKQLDKLAEEALAQADAGGPRLKG